MDNVGDWPMDLPTFTQGLQDMGYHTALTGNIHAHQAVGYDIDLTGAEWDGEIRALGFDDVVQTSGKTMAFFTDDAYTHYLEDHGLLYACREDIVGRVEAGQRGQSSALALSRAIGMASLIRKLYTGEGEETRAFPPPPSPFRWRDGGD